MVAILSRGRWAWWVKKRKIQTQRLQRNLCAAMDCFEQTLYSRLLSFPDIDMSQNMLKSFQRKDKNLFILNS